MSVTRCIRYTLINAAKCTIIITWIVVTHGCKYSRCYNTISINALLVYAILVGVYINSINLLVLQRSVGISVIIVIGIRLVTGTLRIKLYGVTAWGI